MEASRAVLEAKTAAFGSIDAGHGEYLYITRATNPFSQTTRLYNNSQNLAINSEIHHEKRDVPCVQCVVTSPVYVQQI